MAFGGLGGLGGFAPSFPQRFGAPVSNPVQSDQEWMTDWENRLAGIPAQLSRQTSDGRTQLVAGAEGYDAARASPYHDMINQSVKSNILASRPDANQQALGNTVDYAASLGVTMTPDGRGGFTIGRDPYSGVTQSRGGSHIVQGDPTYETFDNPDFLRAQQQFQDAQRMRGETQTRNQQGYDSMMGGQQMNAILGPDYANEGFGQITGQGPTQIPQIDGVNMDWASGVYDPNHASGMFGNSGRARNQGGWL